MSAVKNTFESVLQFLSLPKETDSMVVCCKMLLLVIFVSVCLSVCLSD